MAARRGTTPRDHTVLALDIGSRFIKVAELRLAKGQISLLNIAVGPTPPGVMDNSQILDPVGLGKGIRELLTLNRIKCRRVVVAVSGQNSVVVRPIELPRMTKKELVDTMKFEVERHIPFAVDEVVMDYAPYVPPEELPEEAENMRVLLAVAQEELVLAYVKAIFTAGLHPVALDVQVLAAMRALVDAHQEQGSYEQCVALVNIGAGSTDISIIDKGNLTFTRTVPIGGDTLTQAIADQMGRSLEEAEELKIEYGKIFLEDIVGELPAPEDAYGSGDGFFDAFGATTVVPGAGLVVPLPAKLFTLEETEAPTGLGTPPAQAEAPLFSLDATMQPDDAPVFRFGADEEAPSTPAFTLDSGADAGPVFDLGAELSGQMPAPLSRPSQQEEAAEEQENTFFMAPGPVGTAGAATPEPPKAAEPPLFNFGDTGTAQPFPAPPADEGQPFPNDDLLFGALPSDGTMADSSATFAQEDVNKEDVFQRRIFESMLPPLVELVTEVRRSLEYYATREPDSPVDRIVLYGGASRLPGLVAFIHHDLGGSTEVSCANPLEALDLSQFQQPVEYLEELSPALPVAIGLAMRDMLA